MNINGIYLLGLLSCFEFQEFSLEKIQKRKKQYHMNFGAVFHQPIIKNYPQKIPSFSMNISCKDIILINSLVKHLKLADLICFMLVCFCQLQQIMQRQNQSATYILSRVGLPFETSLPYQPQLIFSQIVLGQLFIRGYRMAVRNEEHQCCIFYKRNNFNTEYLYLKFYQSSLQASPKADFSNLYQAIKIIDNMKQTQQPNYKIILVFLKEKSFSEMDKPQFLDYTTNPQSKTLQKTCWGNEVQLDLDKMMVTSKDQLTKVKDIVWTYINTFGSKYKNNYYCDLQKRNPTSFNIEKLINTVNWIIYCETVNKPFYQIETANWTCFQRRAKDKLKSDRKDILLTGSGKSMMIHLLLLEKIDNYRKEYESQVSDVIFEFRKSYSEGQVKAYEISDELDPYNLIYRQKCFTLQSFS